MVSGTRVSVWSWSGRLRAQLATVLRVEFGTLGLKVADQEQRDTDNTGRQCEGISGGMVDMPAEMSLYASAGSAFPNAAYRCIIKNGSAAMMVIDCWL